MDYNAVIRHIETIDKNAEFLSVCFDTSDNHFYTYLITANDDEELAINCHIEGGIPFCSDGAEDDLDIKEAIPLIDNLNFKPMADYSKITCLVAEHVLFKLFPMLPDPDDIWSRLEQQNFINLAKTHVENY